MDYEFALRERRVVHYFARPRTFVAQISKRIATELMWRVNFTREHRRGSRPNTGSKMHRKCTRELVRYSPANDTRSLLIFTLALAVIAPSALIALPRVTSAECTCKKSVFTLQFDVRFFALHQFVEIDENWCNQKDQLS